MTKSEVKLSYLIVMCGLAYLVSSFLGIVFYKVFLCQMVAVAILFILSVQKEAKMGTSKQEISDWFDRGMKEKKDYMLVVCDTFDHEDFPVYATKEKYSEVYAEYSNGKNMHRIMEVYDLSMERDTQLSKPRCFNGPR